MLSCSESPMTKCYSLEAVARLPWRAMIVHIIDPTQRIHLSFNSTDKSTPCIRCYKCLTGEEATIFCCLFVVVCCCHGFWWTWKDEYLLSLHWMQVKSPHCKIAPVNIAPTFIKIAATSKSPPLIKIMNKLIWT